MGMGREMLYKRAIVQEIRFFFTSVFVIPVFESEEKIASLFAFLLLVYDLEKCLGGTRFKPNFPLLDKSLYTSTVQFKYIKDYDNGIDGREFSGPLEFEK